MSMHNTEFILVLLFITYCIISPTNNCKLTLAQPCMHVHMVLDCMAVLPSLIAEGDWFNIKMLMFLLISSGIIKIVGVDITA